MEDAEMITSYYELLEALKECALEEPNINQAGSKNILELNSLPNIKYDVFYITPNQHKWNDETLVFSLNLYFISRWDESENNQQVIHSRGITKLMNIVNRFSEDNPEVGVNTGTFTLFYQKFKDMTAGVYLTVEFSIPSLLCAYETE